MTTLPEPSNRATPLLDVLLQDSAAGSASVASIRVNLSEDLEIGRAHV